MKFLIRLAGRTVEIHSRYENIKTFCCDYLCSDQTGPDITVTITDTDIEREGEKARRADIKSGVTVTHSPARLEITAAHRKIAAAMTAFDTFLMHGPVISTAGQGYMISAPSGIGKTTRIKLWAEYIPDSLVINGDKPLLRVAEGTVTAYGTPWCGKEGMNINKAVPLRAIFLLERSDAGNDIREMSFSEAFPMLLRQTFRPDDIETGKQTLRLLKAMEGKVKVYRFRSEPTVEAVRLAWKTAKGSL